MERNIFVFGSGPLGVILAGQMADHHPQVILCPPDPEEARRLKEQRSLRQHEETFLLSDSVRVETGSPAWQDDSVLVIAVSSRELEDALSNLISSLKRMPATVVLFTKGIPSLTLRRKYSIRTFSEYLESASKEAGVKKTKFAAVNGPSLLGELNDHSFSFLNIGCVDVETGAELSRVFSSDSIQVHSTTDVLGVEIGGTLKNPIAIACGISMGLPGCGDNFRGELISRGFEEILRFGLAIGARQDTLLGRSGLADLITTSMSAKSRNRSFGEAFIQRMTATDPGFMERLEAIVDPARLLEKELVQSREVVEGGYAIASVLEIARELHIEMPVFSSIYEILSRKSPPTALISAITGTTHIKETPVLSRHKGTQLASGSDFVDILDKRVFQSVTESGGMFPRIKRQVPQVLQLLEKRITKADRAGKKMIARQARDEIDLWKKLSTAVSDEENKTLRAIVHFYTSEIADNYTPGMRETLIRMLGPVRFAVSGFRKGSAIPRIGGHLEDLKYLADRYNILYAPTHRSHLDSVEVAFGLSWMSLPLPRYAAGINLMTDPMQSWLLRSLGAYAVDRERTRNFLYLECLSAYACMLLESGIPSLVYPEGTRSRTGGIATIKTGLLSTAVQAYRNTGREIIVAPIALSYESVPEDAFYCGLEKEPPFKEFVSKRGSVFLDVCEPIRVSHHMNAEDSTLSIAGAITASWRNSLRVLPNHVVARVLFESGHSMEESNALPAIEDFVAGHSANYNTRDTKEIFSIGMKSLQDRGIAKKQSGIIKSTKPELVEYYGNMVPTLEKI